MIRKMLMACILISISVVAADKPTIRSGVPPEFPNGLYSKYLEYIAKEMECNLELIPMPFARRVRSMRSGEIDIMAGMQQTEAQEDEFIYLKPSYESLRHTLFVNKKDKDKLKKFDDLLELTIGVTANARYFERFNEQTDLAMVPVSSLMQKIGLLQKGRINTFIHFQESALPTLEKLALDQDIIIADFQTTERNLYYFTLSKNSPLLPYRERLEDVIRIGVELGDFALIRKQHYGGK